MSRKQSDKPFPQIVNRAIREFVAHRTEAEAQLEDAIGRRDNAREITKQFQRDPEHPQYVKAAIARSQALDQIDFQKRRIRFLNSEISRVVGNPDEPGLFDNVEQFDYVEPSDDDTKASKKGGRRGGVVGEPDAESKNTKRRGRAKAGAA